MLNKSTNQISPFDRLATEQKSHSLITFMDKISNHLFWSRFQPGEKTSHKKKETFNLVTDISPTHLPCVGLNSGLSTPTNLLPTLPHTHHHY